MRTQLNSVSLRRLLAADGYLQFQLPFRAIAELEKSGHAGPLEGPRQLLWGIALVQSHSAMQAIPHLELAARLLPPAARCCAWHELEYAYREVGSDELADLAHTLAGEYSAEARPQLLQMPEGVALSTDLRYA